MRQYQLTSEQHQLHLSATGLFGADETEDQDEPEVGTEVEPEESADDAEATPEGDAEEPTVASEESGGEPAAAAEDSENSQEDSGDGQEDSADTSVQKYPGDDSRVVRVYRYWADRLVNKFTGVCDRPFYVEAAAYPRKGDDAYNVAIITTVDENGEWIVDPDDESGKIETYASMQDLVVYNLTFPEDDFLGSISITVCMPYLEGSGERVEDPALEVLIDLAYATLYEAVDVEVCADDIRVQYIGSPVIADWDEDDDEDENGDDVDSPEDEEQGEVPEVEGAEENDEQGDVPEAEETAEEEPEEDAGTGAGAEETVDEEGGENTDS